MHVLKSGRLHFGEEAVNAVLKPLPLLVLGAPPEVLDFLRLWIVFDGICVAKPPLPVTLAIGRRRRVREVARAVAPATGKSATSLRMTCRCRGRFPGVRALVAMLAAAALMAGINGCTMLTDGVQFARNAFDPGVPGSRPITAKAAAELNDEQIQQRLAFLTQKLEENRTHAAWWYYGFLVVNAGGMAAGAATATVEDNKDDQIYDILNASLGLIGTAYLLGAPLPGRSGADPIYDRPFDTHAQRAEQLALAEDILYGAAGRAKQRTGWLLHSGNLFINAAAASVLLARESYGNAALLFFVNSAVGEAQILLTPWKPLAMWNEYRQFVDRGGAVARDPAPRIGIGGLPGGRGLALRVEF